MGRDLWQKWWARPFGPDYSFVAEVLAVPGHDADLYCLMLWSAAIVTHTHDDPAVFPACCLSADISLTVCVQRCVSSWISYQLTTFIGIFTYKLSTGDVAVLQNALFCGSCRVSRVCSGIPVSYRVSFWLYVTGWYDIEVCVCVCVCRRVSVVVGRVVDMHGEALVGVRVSVVTHPLYGFTLTRPPRAQYVSSVY